MTHSLLSKALDATSFLLDSAHTVGMFEFLPVLEWNLEFQSLRLAFVPTASWARLEIQNNVQFV